MIFPNHRPRIKWRNILFDIRINDRLFIGFFTIAVETGKCEIIKTIRAAIRDRNDMIDCELH